LDETAIDIREETTVYRGFFRIDRYRLRHRLFAGGWSPELSREVARRGDAVGVLLYDPGPDAFVLIEQFRLPAHLAGLRPWQVEIAAGMIEPGEDPQTVARREVEEETGLAVLGELVPIHRYLASPGGSTETVEIFCGRVDSSGAGGIHGLADESEDIRVLVLPYAETMARLAAGDIDNGFTILALYWFAAQRERLRQKWR
jgi:ADP-ribose pyrophosphatase